MPKTVLVAKSKNTRLRLSPKKSLLWKELNHQGIMGRSLLGMASEVAPQPNILHPGPEACGYQERRVFQNGVLYRGDRVRRGRGIPCTTSARGCQSVLWFSYRVPFNRQQREWTGQDVCKGTTYSRYGVQGDAAPAPRYPKLESTWMEASKATSRAPSTSPGHPHPPHRSPRPHPLPCVIA